MRWLKLPSNTYINLALIVMVDTFPSDPPHVALTFAGIGAAVVDTMGDTYTHTQHFYGNDAAAIIADLDRASRRND